MSAHKRYILNNVLVSAMDLAKMVKITRTAMNYRLRVVNGDAAKAIDNEWWKERRKKLLAKGHRKHEYEGIMYTVKELSTVFKMHATTLSRWLNAYGMDAVVLYIKEGIHPSADNIQNMGSDEWQQLTGSNETVEQHKLNKVPLNWVHK